MQMPPIDPLQIIGNLPKQKKKCRFVMEVWLLSVQVRIKMYTQPFRNAILINTLFETYDRYISILWNINTSRDCWFLGFRHNRDEFDMKNVKCIQDSCNHKTIHYFCIWYGYVDLFITLPSQTCYMLLNSTFEIWNCALYCAIWMIDTIYGKGKNVKICLTLTPNHCNESFFFNLLFNEKVHGL